MTNDGHLTGEPMPPSPAPAKRDLDPGAGPGDGVLAAQAAGGDRAAFEALYRRHVARVHGLCLRLTGDQGRAEVLTQDTFVKAWLALGTWSGQGPLGAWLGRIAVNRWRDDWRADRRARARLVDLGPDGDLEATAARHGAAAVEGAPARLLTTVDLERLVGRLPEGARTVFVLHVIEDYPQAEVAALLGVSEGTIKSQVHRARRLLRAMFTEPREERNE
ncbi:MAG: RNA polymerase sigma factor [bacterium]|nr:RNA polymerase sigma factor [bacterium]